MLKVTHRYRNELIMGLNAEYFLDVTLRETSVVDTHDSPAWIVMGNYLTSFGDIGPVRFHRRVHRVVEVILYIVRCIYKTNIEESEIRVSRSSTICFRR